jgi:hypothetical protein
MKINEVPRLRPAAMAGYHSGLFVGYALRTSEGWICISSLGLSWTKSVHRSSEDARMHLRTVANAAKFDWFATVEQLENALLRLPESSMPSHMPEMLMATYGRWQRLNVA